MLEGEDDGDDDGSNGILRGNGDGPPLSEDSLVDVDVALLLVLLLLLLLRAIVAASRER